MSVVKDPAFWTALIALLAIVLSQLPPVRELIKRRELSIVIPDHLLLYHYLGNLQLLGFLALHNTGGRDITVAKLECVIKDGDGHYWSLPGQTYLSRQASAVAGQAAPELIIGWISLKPGGHWAETVHFYKVWSVQDEEEATGISARIRADINSKLGQRKPGESIKPAEADDNLVNEAKDFFGRRFTMVKGNYRLIIAAVSESKEALSVRAFDFTLFDHQIRALRSAVDDYKIGAGVYFPNLDPSRFGAIIRLRPIPDAEARKQYATLQAASG